MSTRTYTKPYVVTDKGAKQIEDALRRPSRATGAVTATVMTPAQIVDKFKKRHA